MSQNLERARLLLTQSRPADAEALAGRAVAEDPNDAEAHRLLALALSGQAKYTEGIVAAKHVVALIPEASIAHYTMAVVLNQADKQDGALRSINEAIRLDPQDTDAFSLKAAIEVSQQNWEVGLKDTEEALRLDPENTDAANLRGIALRMLERDSEAAFVTQEVLRRSPEDAVAHANHGWNLLQSNQPKVARESFREALRLEPGLEYARDGMREAMKATNPVYRMMLAYYLWIARKGPRFQLALFGGIWVGMQVLGRAAEGSGTAMIFKPILAICFVGLFLTWVSSILFNLVLWLDPFGRHVLSRSEKIWAAVFGLIAIPAMVIFAWDFMFLDGESVWQFNFGVVGLFTAMQLGGVANRKGKQQVVLVFLLAGLMVVGMIGAWGATTANEDLAKLMKLYFPGVLGMFLLLNFWK